ncbi:Leader peptidase PppA [Gimesia panareensis]|uniref:Leader peptidase PppA n=2 Tax=Gimesia panareensis TaxID=2527978 RepID=A0A518FWQ3_9PLAN|nr:Leader peptidase PppA [Gimesia panareensis]
MTPLLTVISWSPSYWILEAFTAVWCFVMGSVIGSFLNVVIYRMPLGLNISKPKSRCPVCENPIRTRDNLPILGWLLLRGKCRDCQTPISPRYPIVEALVGTFFLLLYLSIVHSGGALLPYRIPNRFSGGYQILEGRTWDLIALGIYYCYLFVVVLASTYIQFDRELIPRRLLLWCLGIGVLAGCFLPELHPLPARVPVQPAPSSTELLLSELQYYGTLHFNFEWGSLLTVCWGLVYGAIVGILFCWPSLFQTADQRSLFPPRTSWLPVLIGVYLGWQQVVMVGFLSALILALAHLICRNRRSFCDRLPASAFLSGVLTLQLLGGGYLTILPSQTGYLTYLLVTGGQLVTIPILTGLSEAAHRKRETANSTQDQIPLDETSTLTS